MSDLDLQIGIENEMFLYLKSDDPPPSSTTTGKDYVKPFGTDILLPLYNEMRGEPRLRSDFSKGSHAGHSLSQMNEHKWTVTTDDAIGNVSMEGASASQKVKGYALEFASEVFDFCRDGTWREEVKNHWDALLLLGNVSIDDMCATHVHVSPKAEAGWTLKQLQQIAQAVLYFETAFHAIWAPSRRSHDFTRKNKAGNKKLKNLNFGECCELIEACSNNNKLSTLMQETRDYVWNFENTREDKRDRIGTVEFRCAPGVLTAEHCLIWVELAVSFVQAAAQYGSKADLEDYHADVKGLEQFILQAGRKGINDPDRLAIVFHGQPVETDEEMTDIFEKRIK